MLKQICKEKYRGNLTNLAFDLNLLAQIKWWQVINDVDKYENHG